jgi:hypothetical protein
MVRHATTHNSGRLRNTTVDQQVITDCGITVSPEGQITLNSKVCQDLVAVSYSFLEWLSKSLNIFDKSWVDNFIENYL